MGRHRTVDTAPSQRNGYPSVPTRKGTGDRMETMGQGGGKELGERGLGVT